MELSLINETGQASGTVNVLDVVFGRAYNEPLVHQLLVAYQANGRQGTRAQKGRSQIQASTRKPWKQKGTGRARAGMVSSPLWRGGGKIFPSSPDENFTQKINKKMYRAGLCSILSKLGADGRLVLVDDIQLEAPKTKLLFSKFKLMGFTSALVLTGEIDENLFLASRNLVDFEVMEARYLDPISLVRHKKIVLTKSAVRQIEEMLS